MPVDFSHVPIVKKGRVEVGGRRVRGGGDGERREGGCRKVADGRLRRPL